MFKSRLTILAIGCAGLMAGAYGALPSRAPASAVQPVVLELYQSQGCSSCPPALTVLNEVANRPNVLALNFAVTYWDQLGWKDKFAQPAFTARQWDYARAAGRGNVQTPQLIVGGRAAILGSRKGEVEAAIANYRSAPGAPDIIGKGDAVTVGDGKAANDTKVLLVDYDPRNVTVPIRAGENGGRTLNHRNIVRRLSTLGAWNGRSATFSLPKGQPGLARAILVQSGVGGPIIAGRKI